MKKILTLIKIQQACYLNFPMFERQRELAPSTRLKQDGMSAHSRTIPHLAYEIKGICSITPQFQKNREKDLFFLNLVFRIS